MSALIIDEKFLQLVRAVKGVRNMRNKYLAKKCKVSQPKFSNILNGEFEMPESVKEVLIRELELEKFWKRLSGSEELDSDNIVSEIFKE